ncbi:MAG: hypothetical protein EOM83_14310, partial [Clostridia bacterium]|nr:hypothetical protein [Clostridia bacterium]
MKKVLLFVAFLATSCTGISAQNGEDKSLNPIDGKTISVGTLPGGFNISPTGAATYTIPLDLPPGRAGMTPEIALSYNSQTSDGVMGKGWGIAGWSYIERVNETQYYDDRNGSIDFADDVFSWDGNRLIKIDGGINENYYRTEVDNVAQIKMMNANKENTYFIIHTKEGLIKYYGGTTDSRQVSKKDENPAIRYHLNKIEDRKGNYIQYNYERIVGTGELYLKKIKYTLHGQLPNATPYEVDFVYSSIHPKYERFYLFSHGTEKYEYQITKKLDAIKIIWNGVTIKTYTINYVGGGLFETKHFVKNIVLKGLNGTQEYNPTTFDWKFNAASEGIYNNVFIDEEVENFHVTGFNYGSGDFNGDGVTDIIESGLFSMSKEGTFLRVSKNMASIKISDDYFLSPTKFINCDIDGDGRDELFIARSGSLKCYRFHVSGTTITPEDMGEKDITFVAQGDFTGDALADIIVKNNSLYQLHRGNSEFFNKFWNSPFIITNPVFPEGENTFRTGDFNGDGKSDFANFNKNSENTFGVWTLKFNTSPSTYSVENMEFQDFQGISLTAMILVAFDVGDFNGDGKDDMLLTIKYTNGNTETNICYAYGKGWQVNAVTGLGTYYSYFQSEKFGHVVTDLNNDGIADVATYYFTFPASGKVKVNFGKYFKYPGAQGGFQTKSVEHVHNYFPTWSSVKTDPIIMGDFSGNGEKDICYILNFEEWRQSEKLPVSTRRYAYTLTDEEVGSDLIVKATNGLGVQNTLLYSKYNPIQYTYTSYPVLRFMSPFYVVSSVKISNGAGGFFPATTYDYTGMQAHAQGKGLLGFQKINVTDNLAGVKSVTTYNLYINNNMHFFIYPADIKQTALSNNQLLSQTTNKLSVKNLVSRYPKVFYPVPICSFTIQNDLNGTYIGSKKSIQSLDDLDAYGNSTKTIMLKDEWVWNINDPNTAYGWRTTTENQYNQIELQNWLVGRPTQTTTTRFHKENGEHTDITIQNFQYYEPAEAQWPLLNNVTTTPNGSQLLTTQVVYDYDMFGNIIKETLKAPNDNELNDRITHYEYFEDNYYDARFMTKKIVEAPGDNYQTYYWYNQSCGYMTYHKDISGLETTFQYDDMGNHYSTNHPDGNATKHYVYWSSGNSHAPPGAKYHTSNCKLTTQYQQWGLTLTFYDALGRELRTATQSLNGLYVYTDKTYDNKGRLFKVFEPYFKGTSPILYTMMEYDHLGRLETKTNTDGTIITTTYNGRTSKTTNLETGIWSDKTVNAAGIIDLASDISGTTINYNYDGAGRLLLTHAAGVFTTIEYDDAGNRYKLFDPDAGTIESHYNAFGEIKYQKDGQGNEYTMTYDGIGRLLAKFAMQGDFEEIGFQYGNNSSQHGFGQLKEQSVTYPISDNLPFVFYDYTYDRLGRVVAKEESVGNKTFTFTYQYNPYHGQLEYTTYPSGYQIRNIYNTRGYLYQVVEGSKVLWQANQMNARGQLTNYELGNGLVTIKQFDQYGYISAIFTPGVQSNGYNFDAASGNLTSQGNYMKMWWEHYTYDDLLKSRLEGWSISSQVNGSITYLQNGNIDNKSDVTTPSGKYDYASAKPHAVSRVVGPTPQYLQKAKQQTITYTTFNKVKEITQQFYAPAVDRHRLKFNYGPDQARIKTEYCYVMVDGTEILRKTKYFLGNYEIEIDDAGNERKLHYLIAG